MTAMMKIVSMIDGSPSPFDGEYVVAYDPNREGVDVNGRPMIAYLVTSPDPHAAMQYDDTAHAWQEWTRVSEVRPVRHDGRPNRPLTAFTVEISLSNPPEGEER